MCKDVWYTVWNKQIDNLRTNHRGVFMLQDTAFPPLMLGGSAAYIAEVRRVSHQQLAYATGVVQGALQQLGVPATVHVDASHPPQCAFHIRIAQ